MVKARGKKVSVFGFPFSAGAGFWLFVLGFGWNASAFMDTGVQYSCLHAKLFRKP
jgi:hypothetical protein